jgi:hypothetical protein
MLIRVMYNNHKYDMVTNNILEFLIKSGKINKFLRSDGWAVIGKDAIRGRRSMYTGPERRQTAPEPVT